MLKSVKALVGEAFPAFVWGRNVFDEEYSLHGFFFANEPPDWQEKLYEQQADPAQFGLTFTYRY